MSYVNVKVGHQYRTENGDVVRIIARHVDPSQNSLPGLESTMAAGCAEFEAQVFGQDGSITKAFYNAVGTSLKGPRLVSEI